MPKREPEPKTILNLEEVLQEERQALGASPDEKLSALCLSGGGIRSATFGLGVLQGLAKFGLLPQFHYVSTVSGGGYIGGWLSAWISRDPEGAAGVSSKLSAPSTSGVDPECAQLQWLRNFSNYLNPKLGLLSADTWA